MNAHPHDGLYKVETESTALGFFNGSSDGETRIEKSQTNRTDKHGCKWTSSFTPIAQGVVKMTSQADPRNVISNKNPLGQTDGSDTQKREAQTFETLMDITYEDGVVTTIQGSVEANGITVYIRLTRIGD